jgi:hypothetical protein
MYAPNRISQREFKVANDLEEFEVIEATLVKEN